MSLSVAQIAAPDSFMSPAPEVRLTNTFNRAFDNVVATARTCYSAKGIVSSEEVGGDVLADEEARRAALTKRDNLARDIFAAGHHTTYQHAHFQFAVANISRQFIWSFLHSHPFYNSEQVSQRFVTMKAGSYAIPPLSPPARAIYEATVAMQMAAYGKLIEILGQPTTAEFLRLFPGRRSSLAKYAGTIKKKAQEIARYVLPVATFAYMYHTVSGITLIRYWRLCQQFDTPLESRVVIGRMVEELLAAEPDYAQVLAEPLPLESTPEFRLFETLAAAGETRGDTMAAMQERFVREFDAELGGRTSLLVGSVADNEHLLADAVREVFGLPRGVMSDDDAIEEVLNPARNPLLGEALNLSTHSKLARTMFHPHYTFKKRLSHTADSQDQRHRMTPASRPILSAYLGRDPDYIVPALIETSAEAAALYRETMERTWEGIARLRAVGTGDEFAAYLLPNAVALRFTESADLLNLHHKHVMRLCYNAQEEIWRASLDEAEQIRAANPRIGKWLLPPCGIRKFAQARPICPEGTRYCGVPVWNLDLTEYRRVI